MGSENFSGMFNGMDWTMDRHMNYTHSSPTSSAESGSAGNGPHVFAPCSFDEDIATDWEGHGFNNLGAPSPIGNYENGRGWMPADSHSPSNVQATFPCPNCRTHIKLNMAPDTDPTPLTGGGTFKNTALDPRQYQRWSNSLSDPIATIAPGTTMSMPPASVQPAAVVGGGYGLQGAFHRQQQPTVAQPVPPRNTRGATTGTGSILTYDSSSRRTSTANPNSPSSYCDSSSDQSSPNEGNSNNNKRKRLEDKEKPDSNTSNSKSLAGHDCVEDD
ncbi:hypothetical protein PG985_004804 [Apiospora marii]|uniref:Uncharacterized protein n=1 Tax=Apiospora marii TaxID=335849 RepID=A0ABR1SAF3_9PEZI